ncbi:MAG TPA: endo alpha-1,4 polygalactosaminidase [Jiangellaceae bacterium]
MNRPASAPDMVQLVGTLALAVVVGCAGPASEAPAQSSVAQASAVPGVHLPPAGARWDMQLDEDTALPDGVAVVERDWWSGRPLAGVYNICYVNAFQTQPDEPGTNRPDLTRNWPADLILKLEDPGWPGEYLVDIGTPERREAAAAHVGIMLEDCAAHGAQAVELDNLDSWTRDVEGVVPFGRAEAVDYARLLVDRAHALGLAVAQKNAYELLGSEYQADMGFDFAVVEECGAHAECEDFAAVFHGRVFAVEYTDEGLARACATLPKSASVIRRDRQLGTPADVGYVYSTCPTR